jgi:hypothetical protein
VAKEILKGKVTPKQAYVAFRVKEVKAPAFLDNRHIKDIPGGKG